MKLKHLTQLEIINYVEKKSKIFILKINNNESSTLINNIEKTLNNLAINYKIVKDNTIAPINKAKLWQEIKDFKKNYA